MRLVLLTNFVPPYRVPFYKALAKNVDELVILISTPMEKNREWPVNWADLNVRIQRTITLHRTWKHPHGFSESLFIHLPFDTITQLSRIKPDTIISGEFGARTFFSLVYHLLHPRTKFIVWATVSEYSEMGRGFLRETLRKWIIPKADFILVNGKSGERYISKLGKPKKGFIYIPYTSDLSTFLNIDLKRDLKESKRFLFSGQLIDRKGLLEFHQVFCKWAKNHSDRTWEWYCIGDGPLFETLSNLPVPENAVIKLLGNIDFNNLSQFYQHAGIFIFPTLADEWGIVVNEALASGLPVLGSVYSQAVEELVREGENGWQFHPDNMEEIYQKLEKAFSLSDDDLLKMRIASRISINHLSPEIVADKVICSIKELSKGDLLN